MRTRSKSPIATALVLVGAMTLFAGCGDEGSHLPAGMSNASASSATGGATGIDAVDDLLGGDPGPEQAGVSTMLDDPVLAGYDGIDSVGGLGIDDPYSRASEDWNSTEGSLGGLSGNYDLDSDDDLMPVGYGRGHGYGDDFGFGGYGGGVLATAMTGGWGGTGGIMDAGPMDAGLDTGLDMASMDPAVDMSGMDMGVADVGMDMGGMDVGMVDADVGFDPGMDVGVADMGVPDVGMDMGVADMGVADMGVMDAGVIF